MTETVETAPDGGSVTHKCSKYPNGDVRWCVDWHKDKDGNIWKEEHVDGNNAQKVSETAPDGSSYDFRRDKDGAEWTKKVDANATKRVSASDS
jgi:hypothetical protein